MNVAEHALAADDQALAVGRDRVQHRGGLCPDVLVQDGVSRLVQDAEVHGSCVQVDAAVECPLFVVESHHWSPW